MLNIRHMMDGEGRCRVGGAELQLLCPASLTVGERFLRIADIARRERWSFSFEHDGAVVFARLES